MVISQSKVTLLNPTQVIKRLFVMWSYRYHVEAYAKDNRYIVDFGDAVCELLVSKNDLHIVFRCFNSNINLYEEIMENYLSRFCRKGEVVQLLWNRLNG